MPNEKEKIYWDADVFLSYINGIPEKLSHIDPFIDKSGDELQIFTSTISIVEVAYGKAEQDGKTLDSETEKNINNLWERGSPIILIEFHMVIAGGAKDLMRYSISNGWSLKPMDAIHLSTARYISANKIHTYDSGWDKYSDHLGIEISRPISDQPRLL